MITQTTNLNLIPGGVLPRINVSQYDKGSRTLIFNLYNGSASFSVPVGASVTIQGTKPDNTAFQYACTFSGSTVTADLEQQMSVLAGEVTCELVITQSVEGEAVILGTCNFIINVEKSAVSDDTVISDTDLPLIAQAIEAAAEAQASEEAAALSATNASNSADSAEDSAEDSEAWAVGQRNGEDVPASDETYHNNAKYWASQGVHSFNGRSGSVLPIAGDYDAEKITYDNTTSGMTAEDVQAAIDELATEVQAAEARDGDAYNSATTYGPTDSTRGYPSYCIENNVMYKNLVSCAGVAPSDDTSGTYWEETDISTELSTLFNKLAKSLVSISGSYGSGYVAKAGNVVTLHIGTQNGSFSAWTYYTLFTLDEAYRPSHDVYCYEISSGSYNRVDGRVTIATSGDVILSFASAQTTIAVMTITYVL